MAHRDERYFGRNREPSDEFRDRDRFAADRGDYRRDWLHALAWPSAFAVPGLIPFGAPPYTEMLG